MIKKPSGFDEQTSTPLGRILVIDDDQDSARFVKDMLEQAKGEPFGIELVRHIQDARHRLDMNSIDLVLLRMHPGSASRISVTTIRAMTDAPIIVLLNQVDGDVIKEYLRAGAQEVVAMDGLDAAKLCTMLATAQARHDSFLERFSANSCRPITPPSAAEEDKITGVSVMRIVSLSREAAVAVNDNGEVLFANDVACAALTMPLEVICGQPLMPLIDRLGHVSDEVGAIEVERLCDSEWDGSTAHVLLIARR